MTSSDGAETIFRLVEHPQFTISNRKVASQDDESSGSLALRDEGKCPQIRHALADGSFFQQLLRLRSGAVTFGDRLGGRIDLAHPAMHETAFAGWSIVEFASERRGNAATLFMAHNDDFRDFQLGDCEFQRRRNAVAATISLVRRHEVGDIADNEYVARVAVKDGCRIRAAVTAGNDQRPRRLAFDEVLPAASFRFVAVAAEAPIPLDQISKAAHGRCGNREGQGWQVRDRIAIWPVMNAPLPIPPQGPAKQRKPDWIRVKAPVSEGYHETRRLMRELNLATVCEEAACPNIGECWTKKHATVMILGDTCTRACAFCNVKTGMPRKVDPLEPEHVAIAAAKLGLEHIVVTSVDRDDLPDGGASQFVKVIEALRRETPDTTIEILTPDFRNKHEAAVEAIVAARPDVYNHNLETVPRLYPTIRPGARYYASLRLLEQVKKLDPSIFTKSGIMVGLGEQRLEVHQVMDDMRSAGIDFLTMGQYLQPTPKHATVEEFVTPDAFKAYASIARAKGFLLVAASPLTRSSYHAGDDFKKMRDARNAQLARAGQ